MMLFDYGKSYNFNTISDTVLNGVYKNMKCVGTAGLQQVLKLSGVFTDVVTINKQLESELDTTLLSPEDKVYYIFQGEHGVETVIGNDWVDDATIVEINAMNVVYTINNISNDDVTTISNMLRAMGYTFGVTTEVV